MVSSRWPLHIWKHQRAERLCLGGVCAVTFTGGFIILEAVETTQNYSSLCKETEPDMLGGRNTPGAVMGHQIISMCWSLSRQESVHGVSKTPYVIWKKEKKHPVIRVVLSSSWCLILDRCWFSFKMLAQDPGGSLYTEILNF